MSEISHKNGHKKKHSWYFSLTDVSSFGLSYLLYTSIFFSYLLYTSIFFAFISMLWNADFALTLLVTHPRDGELSLVRALSDINIHP